MAIVTDHFDYLFKLVVIGGNIYLIQIVESEKLIYSVDMPPTNLHINLNQLLGWNLPPKP